MADRDEQGRFVKGNKTGGRKKGTLNKATRFNKLIEDDIDEVIKSIVDDAKNGCNAARKLIMDRWLPASTIQALELEQEIDELRLLLEKKHGDDS
jgi:hypothetical protein